MANKKISELTSATPSANSVIPSSDSAGTVTNKVTLQSILDLETRWDIFKPGVPTNLSGTAGNSQVSLTWTAPSVLAQTPITDYTIQYSSNSGSTWTTFSDAVSSSTEATVTGLVNGTTYIFRVAAINSIGTGNYSQSSSSLTPAQGDSYWSYVSLLLHMEGEGQSFTDSSSNNRSISVVGNIIQTSDQAKWGSKSAAASPINTAGCLDITTAAAPSGQDDFCMECWIYPVEFNGARPIFDTGAHNNNSGISILHTDTGALQIYSVSDGWLSASTSTMTIGQWQHIAVVKTSTSVSYYISGVKCGTFTLTSCSSPLYCRIFSRDGLSNTLRSYIDDFRLTVGSNRGYSGDTITVPTTAFPNS